MLDLGTAKVNITPGYPVPLSGYGSRVGKGPFTAIASPLFARVICFRQLSDGEMSTALVVSADLLWWGSERVEQLKQRIRDIWPADHLILHATHSHSGPQTTEMFSFVLGEADPGYLVDLEDRLLAGVKTAVSSMEPVELERGYGTCDIAKNRRKIPGAEPGILVESQDPIDRELTVLRYTAADGRVKAIVAHYACHPVTNTSNVLSAEFPGAAADLLEQELGDGAVCLYLQGTCGDVDPTSDGINWCFGGDEQVRMLGAKFASAVRQVLQAPMERLADVPLTGQTEQIALPLQSIPGAAELAELVAEPGIAGEWSRKLLQYPERLRPDMVMEATLLFLARDFALLAMNGEIVSDYGLFIKHVTNKAVLPLGYTNGMIGYVTTARQLVEGGYEPDSSTRYFMLPAPFTHETEQTIKINLYNLLMAHGLIDRQTTFEAK